MSCAVIDRSPAKSLDSSPLPLARFPEESLLLGSARAYTRNGLDFYQRCERIAGIVQTRFLWKRAYIITEPAAIADVLVNRPSHFVKPYVLQRLKVLFGNGLLTSDGAVWTHHRRLVQPALHSDLRDHADHVVIGEAEDVMPKLVRDLENGCALSVYRAGELPQLDKTPQPDLSLINPRYYSTMAIQYSRGCPFNCEFCDIIEIYGRMPRTKSPRADAGRARAALRHEVARVGLYRGRQLHRQQAEREGDAARTWRSGIEQRGRPFTFFTEASLNLADDEELLQYDEGRGLRPRLHRHRDAGRGEPEGSAQKLQNTRRRHAGERSPHPELRHGGDGRLHRRLRQRSGGHLRSPSRFHPAGAIPMAMVGLLHALPGTQLYRRLVKEGRLWTYGDGNNMCTVLNFVPKMDAQGSSKAIAPS